MSNFTLPPVEAVQLAFETCVKTAKSISEKSVSGVLLKGLGLDKSFAEAFEAHVADVLKTHRKAWLDALVYQPKEYFIEPTFNEISEAEAVAYEAEVESWPIVKVELPENQKESRKIYPRAFEPWEEKEVNFLTELLDKTNDADYLAKLLRRSESSILGAGDKIICKGHYGDYSPNFKIFRPTKSADLAVPSAPEEAKALGAEQRVGGLNDEQSSAVLHRGKRLLVLAGAGSGKTRTLIQKIQYLIEEQGVRANEILAITYTKNAASEMLDRLILMENSTGEFAKALEDNSATKAKLHAMRTEFKRKIPWLNTLKLTTFHGFCYQLLRHQGAKQYDNQFKVLSTDKFQESGFKHGAEEQPMDIVNRLVIQLCSEPEYLLKLKRYLLDYYVFHHKSTDKGAGQAFKSGKNYITLNGTQVRSKSERYIADWLYRHDIAFEYEPKVNLDQFRFYPDFYIPEANLFLEHVSKLSKGTKTKMKEFEHAGRKCVTTYESQMENIAEFNAVLEGLLKKRLDSSFEWKADAHLSYEEEFARYQKEMKRFLSNALQVWDMVRVEGLDFEALFAKASTDQHERVREFYILVKPLLKRYHEYCTNKSYLDFNEMILQSMALLESDAKALEVVSAQYKYILIDEFQDVNNLQVRLIQKILKDETQLFCVGDDWQSIYGFRGSNVDYTVNFKNHFKGAEVVKLTKNYRSMPTIVEAGNHVISYNEHKVDKTVLAHKEGQTKIHLYAGKDEVANVEYVADAVRQLYEQDYQKEDILILHRRSADYALYYEYFKEMGLEVQHSTIHGAKGLEARAVFILGLHDMPGGFPEVWSTDRIYQLIKTTDLKALMEEERRLFYVAITRAKDELFLLSIKGSPSAFLTEIPSKYISKSKKVALLKNEQVYQCTECNTLCEQDVNYCPNCGAPNYF